VTYRQTDRHDNTCHRRAIQHSCSASIIAMLSCTYVVESCNKVDDHASKSKHHKTHRECEEQTRAHREVNLRHTSLHVDAKCRHNVRSSVQLDKPHKRFIFLWLLTLISDVLN